MSASPSEVAARSTPSRLPAIHVLVVAFGAASLLDHALAGLRGLTVTVVDNSRSSEVEAVVAHRGARYLAADSNRGFAAGVNLGLREVMAGDRADVLLLNPDTVLPAGVAQRMQVFLRADGHEKMAVVAPDQTDGTGRPERVAWPLPSPGLMWAEALGLARPAARWQPAARRFVIGSVLLVRREALEDVGLFDEEFFLYAEEADWQARALERGWSVGLLDGQRVEHVGGGTFSDPRLREALFHRAQEQFIRKWYGPRGWRSYRTAAVLGAAARSVAQRGPRRRAAWARLRLYLIGPSRHLAKLPDKRPAPLP